MTDDPVTEMTQPFKVWRVTTARGHAREEVEETLAYAKRADSDILVVRSDLVFGGDHIRSALYHARKAIEEDRNVSQSLVMETLLYASGERQLATAADKMAVHDDADEFVVARLSGRMGPRDDNWSELADRVNPGREAFVRFGVSERELDTVGDDMMLELVLEKLAAVDILRK